MKTIYVSIGNSDGKLTQHQWAGFVSVVFGAVVQYSGRIHGEWYSLPNSRFQNACICFEPAEAEFLKEELARLAAEWGQDSIAWAEVAATEFIGAAK